MLSEAATDAVLDRSPIKPKKSPSMRLVVGIATRGRPSVLADMLGDLSRQSRQPDEIVVAHADESDIGDAPGRFPAIRFVLSPLGLTRQRNVILDSCTGHDLIVFLDDDFYLEARYLEVMEQLFIENAQVVAATGHVLADGIQGPGLPVHEARTVLLGYDAAGKKQKIAKVFNAYGCNMCLRLSTVRSNALRFDEGLPLYGWYEDVDFCRRIARYGSIVWTSTAVGVHLGTKTGRTSGLRLGYSQIANPFYLARKGSVSWVYALASMLSRSLKNLLKSIFPEPYVDRRGRLRGNVMAFKALLAGGLCPSNITRL